MALKTLVLRSKLDAKQKELERLRAKDAEFETREAELSAAVEEMTEETPEEDRALVEQQAEAFQQDKDAHEAAKGELEAEVERLEAEIEAEEKRQKPPKAKQEKTEGQERSAGILEKRKFFGMNAQERDTFFAREDVKDFLQRARELAGQRRAVSGAELTIPDVMLELIRENIRDYSKLLRKVRVRQVSGTARQNIMGTIPEAVWTEMCAKQNELDFLFNQVEVDGYKVGGYVAVCNATLEDSDLSLASELLTGIGQAIGIALDKAILFGTGVKMPLGIFTRLAQTAKPSGYPEKAAEWEDLHTSNILSIAAANSVGIKLFQSIIKAAGSAKGKYSRGEKFWAMNEMTRTTLLAESLSVNAAGAIAAGTDRSMPIIGGEIVELDFIPNNVILGGYGDLYLLAERAETQLARSEHVLFIEDQTVFKGTARYDGLPVIPEGFVAIGLNGTTPSAAGVAFAPDKANTTEEAAKK